MNASTQPKKELTPRQRTAADNLFRIWNANKNRLKLTQEKAAMELGYSTQGAIHQYIRGIVAMNIETILKFAKMLKVHPSKIDPEIVELLPGEHAVMEEPGDYTKSNYSEHQIRVVISEVENTIAEAGWEITPEKKTDVVMYLLPLWNEEQSKDELRNQARKLLKLVVSN